jgi:hypothetical protein
MAEFRVRAGCPGFTGGRRMQWTPEFVVGRLWRFWVVSGLVGACPTF